MGERPNNTSKAQLSTLLKVEKGVVAVIGSGGKTTLLRLLAQEAEGTCVLGTTTRILPYPHIPTCDPRNGDELRRRLAESPLICCGAPAEKGKLSEPSCGIPALAQAADLTILEADGSKRLPLKAHAAWEPVVPEGSRVILVVGASGFGRPIKEVVHRPELFCERTGAAPGQPATPELVARCLAHEVRQGIVPRPGAIVVSQTGTPEAQDNGRRFAEALAACRPSHPKMSGRAPELASWHKVEPQQDLDLMVIRDG